MENENNLNLDSSYEDMIKEQALIKNFEQALVAAAKDITNKLFADQIYHLSAEGYLKLENKINAHCSNMAMDLNHIFWEDRE